MASDSPTGCDILMWIRDIPERTGRSPGQTIDAKDCPHKGWGRRERPPDFKVVHIPDKRKKDMAHVVESDTRYYANNAEETMMQMPPQAKTMLRRRRHFDLDTMSAEDKTTIKHTPDAAECEMAWEKFNGKDVDDRDTALEQTFEQKDRTEELNWMHAKIETGIAEEPPDYMKPARDISLYVAAIDNEMALLKAMHKNVPAGYMTPEERSAMATG
jgi:hypothetical protein